MAKWRQGWYKLQHPEKFRLAIDQTMKSYKDGHVQYKSGLELKSFKYCDLNPAVEEWSLEPFFIPYISPIDGKQHRYFPDLFIKFKNGMKFIVEVKSSAETKPPRKSDKRYGQKMQTYLINRAKWQSAVQVCKGDVQFHILTEKTL